MRTSTRIRNGQFGKPTFITAGLNATVADPLGGGTIVINAVAGADFSTVYGVLFGSTPASSWTMNSPTRITAITPPMAVGVTTISLQAASGSVSNPFEIWAPSTPGSDTLFLDTPPPGAIPPYGTRGYTVTGGVGTWKARTNPSGPLSSYSNSGGARIAPAENPAGSPSFSLSIANEKLASIVGPNNFGQLLGASHAIPYVMALVLDVNSLPALNGYSLPFGDDNGTTGSCNIQWDWNGKPYHYYFDGVSRSASLGNNAIVVGRNIIIASRIPNGTVAAIDIEVNNVLSAQVTVGDLTPFGNTYVGTPIYSGSIYRTSASIKAVYTAQRNYTAAEKLKLYQWAISMH